MKEQSFGQKSYKNVSIFMGSKLISSLNPSCLQECASLWPTMEISLVSKDSNDFF